MTLKSFTTATMTLLFMFTISFSFAQEKNTETYSDKLYTEYKANGIDRMLSSYEKGTIRGNEYTFLSEPLNVLGYRIMSEGDLKAAEKVFLAQIDEYPNEANPYDSYADLLMEMGDEYKAKMYYSKAIELSATMEDLEAKQQMLEASKSKLAKLQKKGMELKFLEGNWKTENYNIQDGERVLSNEGSVNFKSSEDNTLLTGIRKNKEGEYTGTRLITYDAIDENYDMVWISNSLTGIEPSVITIEKSTPEEVVMVEEFKEEGRKVRIRHELKKFSKEVNWDIHDISDGQDSNLVVHMLLKKSD